MRVLVTGANGLVGSRLILALAAGGHEPIGTGRGARRLAGPGQYFEADLGDAQGLSRAVTEAAPQIIVNCGGMTDVDGCERERAAAWAANVEGVATLCHAANAVGAHLVHVSTDYIFDGNAGPYDVDAIANPRGIYATTKFGGELAVRSLAKSWAIARTAVVFGWPAAGRPNFGSWLVATLRDGKPIKLFDDQWVSPSLALNVAQMLLELAEKRLTGVFHTSGAEVVDRVTFGLKVAARFGFDASLISPSHMRDVQLAIPRPVRSGLDVTKTVAMLQTRPLTLNQSLDRFYAEYQGAP